MITQMRYFSIFIQMETNAINEVLLMLQLNNNFEFNLMYINKSQFIWMNPQIQYELKKIVLPSFGAEFKNILDLFFNIH